MLRLAADEDFNNVILRGARRRNADLDIVRVQHVAGLSGADDRTVLEWAAREDRVLFTHDTNTMTAQAYQRIKAGEPMPGLFAVPRDVPVGVVIELRRRLARASHLPAALRQHVESNPGGLPFLVSVARLQATLSTTDPVVQPPQLVYELVYKGSDDVLGALP